MAGENNLIVSQEQRFGRFFRWFFILDSVFFFLFILGLQFFLCRTGEKPIPIAILAAMLIIPISISIPFWLAKLQTQVRSDGLYVRFFPFHIKFKRFAFEDFSEYYAREYRPIWEYGGWGIRYTFRNGRAYNIRGNKGLQIVCKNGKKLLIGSQKPQELVAAIDSILKRSY
jgi:hypothetical protein